MADENEMIRRAIEVAGQLDGTCKSLEELATHDETLNSAFCRTLDDRVMLCEFCGWWGATDEMHIDGNMVLCEDCNKDEDND
jgi:hypothetical protein